MASYSVINSLRSDGDNVSKVHHVRTQCSQKLKWPPIIFSLPCARRAIKMRIVSHLLAHAVLPVRDAKCGLLCARLAIRTGHLWVFPFPCDRLDAEMQSGHLGRICRLNRVWPVELDRSSHALDRSRGRDRENCISVAGRGRSLDRSNGRDGKNSIRPENLTPPSDSRRESRLKSG